MEQEREQRTTWLSWLAFLAGLWLIVSPFILGYSDLQSATTNDVVVGVVVAALALITVIWGRATASWLLWIVALVGIWEIAAPFILRYTGDTTALWNGVIFGVAILILSGARSLSLQGGEVERRFGPTFYSEERPKEKEKEKEGT
jgi:hypothetical protein